VRRRHSIWSLRGDPGEGLNVTPLIDVVMVLIVFFLMVGKLASDRSASVRLPESATGRSDEARPIVLALVPAAGGVGAGGSRVAVQLDGRELPPGEPLAQALMARATELAGELSARSGAAVAPTDVPVEVRADRAAEFADVAPILRAARQAKLRSLRLVTSRAGETGGAP
jgi:biopolymer transport protein ExbD